jgi:hypothetical protein
MFASAKNTKFYNENRLDAGLLKGQDVGYDHARIQALKTWILNGLRSHTQGELTSNPR